MYFDPISAWLVALLFDGAEVLAEQTRGGTIAEYHKERIAQLNRNLNGSIRRERKKYELAVPEMELERIQLHIRIAKKSFEFQQGNGEIIIDPDNQDSPVQQGPAFFLVYIESAQESYAGLLVNHRTETHGRSVTPVPEDEQYRHENFFPVIIDREEWEQVQALLKANAKPYRGNTASHRYAGLLTCGDCGSTFVPRIRCWNGNRRVEYLCKSYMHHGKDFCPSHRIRESELDTRVQQYADELRSQWIAEQADQRRLHRLWEMKRPAIQAHIAELYDEIQRVEQEIDDLLLEKIHSGG